MSTEALWNMASNQMCPSLLETSIIAAISKQPLRFWDGRRSCWDAVAQRKEKLKKQIRRHIKESQMISTVLSTSNSLAWIFHMRFTPLLTLCSISTNWKNWNCLPLQEREWQQVQGAGSLNLPPLEAPPRWKKAKGCSTCQGTLREGIPCGRPRQESGTTKMIQQILTQIYIDHRDVVQTTSSLASKYL